jgi:SAM-dependent methyltransferase
MTDPKNPASQVEKSWDTYWQGSGESGAYSSGGASHPAIKAFWESFFQPVQRDYTAPSILDIASGNGAVVECALQVFGESPVEISCVDVSESAIANIQSRFPRVSGIVADACSIPLEPGAFDIVTSQFGIEYAGLEAIDEAGRLLAGGGQLAFLLHNKAGSIHQECAINLDAVSRVQESRFVDHAIEMFRTGFEAVRGADRAPYDQAAKQLAPAVSDLEGIMNQYGEQVADETVARLYADVGKIHSEIQHYEPDEVLSWLSRMGEELEAYAGRMSSMRDAALDGDSFERLCAGLRSREFALESAGPFMVPDSESPLAWALIARK